MARTKKKGSRAKKAKVEAQASASENVEMEMDNEEGNVAPAAPSKHVWQPGVDGIEDGEELQFDPTAYDCLHAFNLGWPCLRWAYLLVPM